MGFNRGFGFFSPSHPRTHFKLERQLGFFVEHEISIAKFGTRDVCILNLPGLRIRGWND